MTHPEHAQSKTGLVFWIRSRSSATTASPKVIPVLLVTT